MDYKKYIAQKIEIEGFSCEEIETFIEIPPEKSVGDYALPCFRFSRALKKAPNIIAQELKDKITPSGVIKEVQAVGGYLNFFLDRTAVSLDVVKEILDSGEKYGSQKVGDGKTVCIDYSSINIAKPFHIGHLSTTVIGGALYRIYNFLGYKAVGINHLGDYGTQFGKLIYAYKNWGSREEVEKGGIKELTRLYVDYHAKSEENPAMDDEARRYFKLIEEGDSECVELFNWFKEMTIKEVNKIYDLLDIHFDSYAGESFYNDKMQVVVDELTEKNLLVESDGAKIVDLEEYNMPPCIILRSDGASLYATRDIAAAIYRKNTYDFYKCLYVVAYQQDLHFKQFFKTLELMGKIWAKDMVHVSYGMVSLEDGAMSTRHGKVVLLEDVIRVCMEKALNVIEEKNPSLENKEEVAKMIGTGAVIFGALQNNKIKDIVFSYDKVLSFEGETGPYVQYTVARCNSVMAKSDVDYSEFNVTDVCDSEYNLAVALANFPSVVLSSAEKYEPSFVTRYAIDVAKAFNRFYLDCKILNETGDRKKFRLALCDATRITLKNALSLLGIKTPERM